MRRIPHERAPGGLARCCGPCGRELPHNTDWFDRDASKDGGYKTWCKECRKERREGLRLKQAAALLETLDKTLIENIANAKPGGSTLPHQAELYQVAMTMLGGVQGWGMHWMAQYLAAKPGSQTRERMLGQIQKLSASVSDSNKVQMPAEMMSDEDLDAEIQRRDDRMKILPASISDAKAG